MWQLVAIAPLKMFKYFRPPIYKVRKVILFYSVCMHIFFKELCFFFFWLTIVFIPPVFFSCSFKKKNIMASYLLTVLIETV